MQTAMGVTDVRDCDEALVKAVFLAHDTKDILKIKIPKIQFEDVLAWHCDKSGLFIVYSAYCVALQALWSTHIV